MLESVAKKLKLQTSKDSKYFIPKANGGYSKYDNCRNKILHYLLPNCTSGAYGLAMQFMETTDYHKVELAKANAADWYRLSKWKKSKYPVVGAIACWSGGTGNKGHVAVVLDVERDSNGNVLDVKETLESSYYGYKGKDWRRGKIYKYNRTTGSLTKSHYKFLGYLLCPNVVLDPLPDKLSVKDKVKIISSGNSRKDGKGKVSGGVGWVRYILRIFPGAKYPYQIGNAKGTITGYYTAKALKKL